MDELNLIGVIVLCVGGLVIWSAVSGGEKKSVNPAPPLPMPELPARTVHQGNPAMPQQFNPAPMYQDAYQPGIDPAMLQQALQLLQVVQILQGNQGKNGHNSARRGIQWRQEY